MLLYDVLEAITEVSHWSHADELDSLRTKLLEDRTEGLRLQAKKYGLNNAAVSANFSKTSLEIVREVLRNRHDLVIKTGRGRADGRRVVFGSTAMHLIRKCPCPVLLVGPGVKTSTATRHGAGQPGGRATGTVSAKAGYERRLPSKTLQCRITRRARVGD